MCVLGVALRKHLQQTDPRAGIAFFADDFAWWSRSWRAWFGLGALLQRLRATLGLQVNWAKSLAVSASPPDADSLATLLAEGWVLTCFVTVGTHLGVLQGPAVTATTRWAAPIEKLIRRATVVWNRARFSETERIVIWQVWLESVLSYMPVLFDPRDARRVLNVMRKWCGGCLLYTSPSPRDRG